MTLLKLLEINEELLANDEKMGMAIAELFWIRNGEPKTAAKLVQLLEAVIEACTERDLRYPRVLLKRKKEIERGTWKPCATKLIGTTGKSAAEKKLGI